MSEESTKQNISENDISIEDIHNDAVDTKYNQLVTEAQALQLLEPLDQSYSTNQNLQGIRKVYRFICETSRSFSVRLRANLPSRREIIDEMASLREGKGDIAEILEYLIHQSTDNPTFVKKYYGAVSTGDLLVFKPIYIAGNEDINKIIETADKESAKYIAEMAGTQQPWSDKDSHLEFLLAKVKESKINETYFLKFLQVGDQDDTEEEIKKAKSVFQRKVLPHLKGREEILYLEVPVALEVEKNSMQSILLVNDGKDIIDRFEYFCKLLIQTGKKIGEAYKKYPSKKELLYHLEKNLEKVATSHTPESYKNLAGSILDIYKRPDTYRQLALEVFLIKDHIEKIITRKKIKKEELRKRNLDLLLAKVHSRRWLSFVPSSFYPMETFEEAMAVKNVFGIRKSQEELGLSEDHYCFIESSNIQIVLDRGNLFEVSILEQILKSNSVNVNSMQKKQMYLRKKYLVYLFLNPFLYLLRAFLPGKKKFIEKAFHSEVTNRGFNFRKDKLESFNTCGITLPGTDQTSDSVKTSDEKTTERERVTKLVLDFVFPNPSPSSKHINEVDYKARLRQAARKLRNDPSYKQYYKKSEDAIIADIETFAKSEIIEDEYDGPLPYGTDAKGQKYTKKTYIQKDIIDYPIVYNSIKEEMEHESAIYGSKELVEYYKSKSKVFSEENMHKARQEKKLKKEAEKKRRTEAAAFDSSAAKISDLGSKKASTPAKPSENSTPGTEKELKKKKRSFFKRKKSSVTEKNKHGKENKPEEDESNLNIVKRVQQTAAELNKELQTKFVTHKSYSGAKLFPMTGNDLELSLNLATGSLSVFANSNKKLFADNFVPLKAGNITYYFPKKFFSTKRNYISQFYDSLIKHEENLALPNGEILRKAHDISTAIKMKKL